MWKLIETNEFRWQYEKLSSDLQLRFGKQFEKVKMDLYTIGKPLGYPWFRELKNNKFRVYYLIYESQVVVLFVAVSDKNSQQKSINIVKQNLPSFSEYVKIKEKNLKSNDNLNRNE